MSAYITRAADALIYLASRHEPSELMLNIRRRRLPNMSRAMKTCAADDDAATPL